MTQEYEMPYGDWTREQLSRGRSLIAQMSEKACGDLGPVVADYLSACWTYYERFWSFSEEEPGQTAYKFMTEKLVTYLESLKSAEPEIVAKTQLFEDKMLMVILKAIGTEERLS